MPNGVFLPVCLFATMPWYFIRRKAWFYNTSRRPPLKVENLCALVEVAPSWYGILFSCADTKKKSNLMLALFSPGPCPVPWLGDLSQLGPLEEAPLEQGFFFVRVSLAVAQCSLTAWPLD